MSKENHLLQSLSGLLSGLIFGIGLSVSEMINPQRVLGFLDLAGSWDPSLAFVMGGALLISFPAYALVRKFSKPLCTTKFHLPTSKDVDKRLVSGAVLFGIGWGLAGFCPGPALAALVTGKSEVITFVISMVAGMLVFQVWDRLVRR